MNQMEYQRKIIREEYVLPEIKETKKIKKPYVNRQTLVKQQKGIK